MTEDRWRPLTAFALVSLLCAVILAVNLGRSDANGVVRAREAGTQVTTANVVFGDVLHPQASSVLSARLGDVGPLSGAVAQAARARTAHPAHRSGRAHATHHAKRSHHVAVAKGKSRRAASENSTVRAVKAASAKATKAAHVRHRFPATRHDHGRRHGWGPSRWTRHDESRHHVGWGHHRNHGHHGWGHHFGWGHRR